MATSVVTQGAWDIEIVDGGTRVGLMLQREYENTASGGRREKPLSLPWELAAAELDTQFRRGDVTAEIDNFSRGMGWTYDDGQGGGAKGVEDLFRINARSGYGALKGPKGTDIALPAPVIGATGLRIIGSAIFDDDLWFITNGRYVVKVDGSTYAATLTKTFEAGNLGRSLCVFEDFGSVTKASALYASTNDDPGGGGKLWMYSGGAWTALAATAPYRREEMCSVFWEPPDSAGFQFLVGKMSDYEIAYTYGDPMDTAPNNWVENVQIGNPDYEIVRLVASRRRVFAVKADGVYSIDELGNVTRLNEYEYAIHGQNGLCAQLYGDYLVMGLGYGADRIYVREEDLLQKEPGFCAPWFGMPYEGVVRGYPVASTSDQGYMVMAFFDPISVRTFIMWARDARSAGLRSHPNPYVWYGPEIVCDNASGERVTHMRVHSPGDGALDLIVASELQTSPVTPILTRYTLSVAGQAVQQLSLGATAHYRVTEKSAYITTARQVFESPNALKMLREHVVRASNANADNGVTLSARADPEPTGSSYTQVGDEITTSGLSRIVPESTEVPTGHELQLKFSLSSDSTGAHGVVLRSWRGRGKQVVNAFKTWALEVRWGAGMENRVGAADVRDADAVLDTLVEFSKSGYLTLVEPTGKEKRISVEQALRGNDVWDERTGRFVHSATLQLSVIE